MSVGAHPPVLSYKPSSHLPYPTAWCAGKNTTDKAHSQKVEVSYKSKACVVLNDPKSVLSTHPPWKIIWKHENYCLESCMCVHEWSIMVVWLWFQPLRSSMVGQQSGQHKSCVVVKKTNSRRMVWFCRHCNLQGGFLKDSTLLPRFCLHDLWSETKSIYWMTNR